MRTTLDLDRELLDEAKRISNARSKKAVIEEALRELIAERNRRLLIERIQSGDLGIDMTLEELWKMRGCDKAREENARRESRKRRR